MVPADMSALDGNAIAGQLYDVFGGEMTPVHTVCANCGATGRVAELVVYLRGPGTVARCRHCGVLSMVLVTIRGITCVDLRGIAKMTIESPTEVAR